MELPVTCGFFLPGFESIHFVFDIATLVLI